MRGEVTSHVLLGRKSHSGLYYTQRIYGRNSPGGKQTWRPEGFNEYCSPEMDPPSEAVEGKIAKR